jgi:hypothetical protein
MTTQATETFTLTLTDERSGGTVVVGAHATQDVTVWNVTERDGRALVTYDGMSWRIADVRRRTVRRQTDGTLSSTLSVGLVRQTRKGTDYVRNGYLWTSIEHLPDAMQSVIRASVPSVTPTEATPQPEPILPLPKPHPCGGMTLVQIKANESGTHHTTAIVDPLRLRMARQLVKYAIQRNIFCPFTGKVMDVRTAVALFAPEDDGGFDFKTVMHPDAWPTVKANALKNFPTWYVSNVRPSAL